MTTNKQRLFIIAYLETFNATEAARRAGYKGNEKTLRSVGAENLTKPDIAAAIALEIEARAMSATEALQRTAAIARGPGAFITVTNAIDAETGQAQTLLDFNYRAIIDAGLGYLIKSITPTRYGQKIEFYDAQRALETLLKASGAFIQKVEVATEADQILVIGGVNLDDV